MSHSTRSTLGHNRRYTLVVVRALVIYQAAILNLEVIEGELSAASRVELEVYENPRASLALFETQPVLDK